MFKRKKKKTGIETPELRKPTPPPPIKPNSNFGWQPTEPTNTKPPKPPTSGSNAVKPNPVQVYDISTVEIMCHYETPCGWCCKWDKKCDKKIGCGTTNNKPQRGLRAKANMYDDAMNPCINCAENNKVFNLCAECGGAPNYKKFRAKETKL